MRILITGADSALARFAEAALRERHELRLTDADLRDPDATDLLVAGCDAVVHAEPYALYERELPEAELLDRAGCGTYVLLKSALKAGVRRVVLPSRLELLSAYPPECVVTEAWQPQPAPTAAALAPYLAELAVREIARAEEIVGVCLRFGPLGEAPEGTTPEDAAAAIERALTMDLGNRKYRWWLYHVCSTDRYKLSTAADPPLSFTRSG